MAASLPVRLPADFVKEIECRVCMCRKSLRILPCGHKCCSECIDRLAGERGQFPCPECRRDIVKSDEGFPVCFISDYLREELNKQTSQSLPDSGRRSSKCRICKEKSVEGRCRDCKQFLCFRCCATEEGCSSQSGRHGADPFNEILNMRKTHLSNWQDQTRTEVDEKALELFTLKEEIQQMQVEISKKEEYVQMIEKIVDEKRSLLKVSEFIQTEQDEAELVILIEQMFSVGNPQSPPSEPAASQTPPTALSYVSQKAIKSNIIYSVQHHSTSGEILIGCNEGLKTYNKENGKVSDLENYPCTVVKERKNVVFFFSQSVLETPNKKECCVFQYDADTKKCEKMFSIFFQSPYISDLSFSDQHIAVIDQNEGSITLYDRKSGSLTTKKAKDMVTLYKLCYLPDNEDCLLATGTDSNKEDRLNKYRVDGGTHLTLIWSCQAPEVRAMTIDTEGRIYANGKRNRKIYIISSQGILLRELTHKNLPDGMFGISIKGDELIVAGESGKIIFFTLSEEKAPCLMM